MNLIAMIGTVHEINKTDSNASLWLKIQKPFLDKDHKEYFDLIQIYFNPEYFNQDLAFINKGSLIGLKGRLKNEANNLLVIAEKIQILS